MPFWWKLWRRVPRRLTIDEASQIAMVFVAIAQTAPSDSELEKEAVRRALLVLEKVVPVDTIQQWRELRERALQQSA